MENYMVYDIGGSSVKWSVINKNGEFLKSGKLSVPDNAEEFFTNLIKNTNENKEEFNLQGICISAPGAVDSKTGIIGGMSAIPYIHGPNFKEIFREGTGLEIAIENDANCAALGECWLGAAKEENDSAFVVCGTGRGGAIVKDKKVHTGVHNHGGEFGYCLVDIDVNNGKYDTWSKIGSTFQVAKSIASRKGIDINDFDGIKAFQLYDNGDEIAVEEVNKFFRYMAIGIYNIQYTYDPEVIVLGGAICERPGFIDEINVKLKEILDCVKDAKIFPLVRKAQYGNDANKLGALYNFLYC